jgi:hypothetical protein
MGFGWTGCWPLQWGGGPTPIDSALGALKAGVGKGHAADIDGAEWRWREARSIGIAIMMTMGERAVNQHNPSTATSAVPFYTELFQLFGFSDQQVRDQASTLANETGDTGTLALQEKLQAIDQNFSLLAVPYANSVTTMHGAAFEGLTLKFNFVNTLETQYPNYSTEFMVNVAYAGGPPTTDAQSNAVAAARALLDDELPAWVDYSIGAGDGGFILDSSHLDWDRFNP